MSEASLRFDPDDTVLLAIDLQRAFCSPRGSVARQGRDVSPCAAACAKSAELVSAAHAAGIRVIWTLMHFRRDYRDGGILVHELRPGMKKVGALREGSRDTHFMPDCDYTQGDFLVYKNRYSAFLGTELAEILDDLETRRIVVCGVTTSMCVETTVRDASQRDWLPYVVADACGDFDRARHEASLAAMEFGFARIVDTAAALAAMRQGDAAA